MRTRPFILVAPKNYTLTNFGATCKLPFVKEIGSWKVNSWSAVQEFRNFAGTRKSAAVTQFACRLCYDAAGTSSHSTPYCFTTFFQLRLSLASVPSCHFARLSCMLHDPPVGERSKLCRCTWLQNYVTCSWVFGGQHWLLERTTEFFVRTLTNWLLERTTEFCCTYID